MVQHHQQQQQQQQQPSLPFIPQLYAHAQELNLSAALFLKNYQYDKAIATLTRTLQLWKKCHTTERNAEGCLCQRYNPNSSQTNNYDTEMSTIPTSHQQQCTSKQVGIEELVEQLPEDPSSWDCGYIYPKLMQIPCRTRFGNHNVNSAVVLITVFNLAIVHHLQASRMNSRPLMAKTLRLYQLATHSLDSYVTDTHNSCGYYVGDNQTVLLFQMILLNNLSHLHMLMGDPSQSHRCTEQLIPLLMFVVEDEVRNAEIRRHLCLEGFFRNVTPFVLTSQCADAA